MTRRVPILAILAILALGVVACQPTVKVEAPDKPIEINLNIKIEQEVRVKIERDLEQVFQADPSIFGVPTQETTP